jgi:hypothetical protein
MLWKLQNRAIGRGVGVAVNSNTCWPDPTRTNTRPRKIPWAGRNATFRATPRGMVYQLNSAFRRNTRGFMYELGLCHPEVLGTNVGLNPSVTLLLSRL